VEFSENFIFVMDTKGLLPAPVPIVSQKESIKLVTEKWKRKNTELRVYLIFQKLIWKANDKNWIHKRRKLLTTEIQVLTAEKN
jgi:hypothetical protein